MLEARKLDVELRRGIVDYLAGQAFDRSSPEGKKKSDERLDQAVARFNQLFQKYRSAGTLAASYALLWEGRVRQELGQMQEAEDIYKEVLSGERRRRRASMRCERSSGRRRGCFGVR